MGGVLILFAVVVSTLLWAEWTNPYVWVVLGVTLGCGLLGFADDYKKAVKKQPEGVSARTKLFWQGLIALGAGVALYLLPGFDEQVSVPLIKGFHPDIGMFYVPLAAIFIVGFSNAVNLTDGLDGLAIGPSMIAAGVIGLYAYAVGHHGIATYLELKHVGGAGTLAIFCASLMGAGLGFLWFNTYPASVFMGRHGIAGAGRRARDGRGHHPPGDRAGRRRRPVHGRDVLGDPAGGLVQAARPPRVRHGADPPPLRAARLAGAEDHRALLDRRDHPGPGGPLAAQTPLNPYAGKNAVVVGMGRSGAAALQLLLRRGARVSAYDRDAAKLEGLGAGVERLSGPALPDLGRFDLAVASPGVPLPADARVMPEVDLAAPELRAPLIGVTGSNGKSTTTVLIGRMLEASGLRALVGGNLGTPLCEFADREADWVVAELSSFQLERAQRLRAQVAVLLNLAPDHLDRHGSLAAYGAAKARLAELQDERGWLIAGFDDAWARDVARRSKARVFGFSQREALRCGASLRGGALVVAREGRAWLELPLAALSRAARTPLENALAASAAACAAGAAPDAIARVLAAFEGLPHRSQLVHERAGVRFVDDSKATNPAAAAASLAAQTGPVVWIAGGRNKGLDLGALREPAARAKAIVLYGEAAAALASALGGRPQICERLEDAVRAAAALAAPGDTVLLAPACASFDQFTSFEARGTAFARAARGLGEQKSC
jgi:UDP-N-acetylmuramoylalanine--D-glutamate ligase